MGLELFFGVLILAMAGHSSANYCVCKGGDPKALQTAIDYACANGADCNPIRPNGACYNPNTIESHCSYAVNSYYQKKASSGATCDFGGVAALSTSMPGLSGGCASSGTSTGSTGAPTSGSGTTPVTVTPSTTPTTPATGAPGSSTPYPYTSTTPSTSATPSTASPGILGGVGTGLGPTAAGLDDLNAGKKLQGDCALTIFMASMMLAFMLLWN